MRGIESLDFQSVHDFIFLIVSSAEALCPRSSIILPALSITPMLAVKSNCYLRPSPRSGRRILMSIMDVTIIYIYLEENNSQ